MRHVAAAIIVVLWCALACTAGAATAPPAELQAAQEALSKNIALATPLAGKAVTEAQAKEADELAEEGLTAARAYAAAQPGAAEARHMIGMLLVFAYRPVIAEAPADGGSDSPSEETVTYLRQGAQADCQRGVTELYAATRLAPESVQYQLDYAEGLQICGQVRRSAGLLGALWERGPGMTTEQRARASRMLAEAARDQNRPQEEAHWLREALIQSPDDPALAQRLEELSAVLPPVIHWVDHKSGMAAAKQRGKPVMIAFMAAWCPSCRRLNGEAHANPEVIALSGEFVCIWVDIDRQGDVKQAYGVTRYPTTVFLDPHGEELDRFIGAKPAHEVLAQMRRAQQSAG